MQFQRVLQFPEWRAGPRRNHQLSGLVVDNTPVGGHIEHLRVTVAADHVAFTASRTDIHGTLAFAGQYYRFAELLRHIGGTIIPHAAAWSVMHGIPDSALEWGRPCRD